MVKAVALGELAKLVGGQVFGDSSILISKVAAIDEAGVGEISFLSNPRYQRFLSQCRASAVIVPPGIARESRSPAHLSYLEAASPYLAFAKILQLFFPTPEFDAGVSLNAHVDVSAKLAAGITVGPNVYVGPRARIGRGSVIFPGVFIGADVQIGSDCVLHPNVVIRESCRIGDRVILHAGVVIGSDGFGYAVEGGARIKIPQIGIVDIGDDVEIGANSTVDRATLGRTIIGRGTKIDNLVQVAHNVSVGEDSVFAAQVGIAGSTRIGKNVTLAGQVGVGNHLEIGDGATIGPKSGVARSVEPYAVLSGWVEASPHRQWLRAMMLLPELPRLWRSVKNLEKKMLQLLKAAGKENDDDDRG
ncbi:MAG TPA: UDP-3-O-(3-hydroxymyristoyl)glucosamine N-acyltransferase [Verrucomicrobiae bacterium]|nr:UDP-3-O-(3-hydroxymyristoyl)glucosamine N-acyltransferase [Verrucomicrobiae bacterium]